MQRQFLEIKVDDSGNLMLMGVGSVPDDFNLLEAIDAHQEAEETEIELKAADQVRETVANISDKADAKAAREPALATFYRNFIINHIVSRTGRSRADVSVAVAQVESETPPLNSGHPLLDWIMNGGLVRLIEMIIAALALIPK